MRLPAAAGRCRLRWRCASGRVEPDTLRYCSGILASFTTFDQFATSPVTGDTVNLRPIITDIGKLILTDDFKPSTHRAIRDTFGIGDDWDVTLTDEVLSDGGPQWKAFYWEDHTVTDRSGRLATDIVALSQTMSAAA